MQEALHHTSDISRRRRPLHAQASKRIQASATTLPSLKPSERDADALWNDVRHLLQESAEQRIAYLLFHCGLTPDEIVHRCSTEFPNLQEVLHLRYVVLTKLCSMLDH